MQTYSLCPVCNLSVPIGDDGTGSCPNCQMVVEGEPPLKPSPPTPPAQAKRRGKVSDEPVFFDQGNVLVTSSRIEIDNKSYAVRNISAVSVGKAQLGSNRGVFLIVLGVAALFTGLGLLPAELPFLSHAVPFALSVACFILAFFLWQKLKPVQQHILTFMTTARDFEALRHTDVETLRAIKSAIENAIAEN